LSKVVYWKLHDVGLAIAEPMMNGAPPFAAQPMSSNAPAKFADV
jgi:hypothetical protein